MIFFMTVPAVMIVTIILIHEAAKYFGKEISYLPLIICAILAILVDVAAAVLSTAPDNEYFYKFFILIFLAATFVTALNRFLEVKK